MIKSIKNTGEKLPIALFISGSMTARNRIYSLDDFNSLKGLEKKKFSVYDDHEEAESKDIEEGCGLPLARLLNEAGVENPEEIMVRSVDGFEAVIPELGSKRYYFPKLKENSEEGKELREAWISFYKNGKQVKFYPHPTIMFGQQGLNEQNKAYFAKGICSLTAGAKDRAFRVRGSALDCNRYFSLDQLFGLAGDGNYEADLLEITEEDGRTRRVPGIKCPDSFWTQELKITDPDAKIQMRAEEGLMPVDTENLYFFLRDPALKQTGAWDGRHIWEKIDGLLVGQEVPYKKDDAVRLPDTSMEDSDFYLRILGPEGQERKYYYSLPELTDKFQDIQREEVFEYYNHNMDKGRGGIRRVTGHGFLLADLLRCLPEITGLEMIEDGSISCRICTKDTYKQRLAFEGNELTAFSYLLTFEQDQRTRTGLERGDTSTWEDEDLHFEKIEGQTPYRIYCKKTSANPAVYKNAWGLEVEIR